MNPAIDIHEMVRLHRPELGDQDTGPKLDLNCADLQDANLPLAYLRAADLRGAKLQRADLRGANLLKADLRGADLRWADLRGANLRWADLQDANLQSANLQVADLRWANLKGADLQGADLRRADLLDADLQGADLRLVNLRDANLQGVDLREANLREVNLRDADLTGAIGLPPTLPPEVGAFTGFKRCSGNKIVELLIPADAYRSSAGGRKCRSSKALVVSVDGDATPGVVAYSIYHPDFRYEVGLVAACDCWEPDRWAACGGGIHFYLTRKEAIDHK